MILNLIILLIFTLIWISIIYYFRVKKKKSLRYLACFTIFYIYFFKVLDYTLFQFQSLIILKYFNPNLMLKGQSALEAVNLIPLVTLSGQDVKTSLLNILLTIPFGLGLPVITDLKMKKVVIFGVVLSLFIEVMQFATGYLANITFRIADINDVIFNTLGVVIGYILFIVIIKNSRLYITRR